MRIGPFMRSLARPSPAAATGTIAGRLDRRDLAGVLISLAIVLAGFHSVAFGGRTFDTSAQEFGVNGGSPPTGVATKVPVNGFRVDPAASAWAMVPWAQVVHRELSRGELPLWNPYEGAGAPLAANGQSAVYDPLMLAVNLHPTTRTWDLSFLFAFMIGAVGMYLFLRLLGLPMLPALAGTAAFSLSGYFATDNNATFVTGYLYLPWLFLFVDRVAVSRRVGWTAALGMAVAGTILVGMPETAFFCLAAAVAYGVLRVFTSGPGARFRVAGRLLTAGLLGALLALPLIVLMAGYLPFAYSSHTATEGTAAASMATLLNWLVPFVNGYPGALRLLRFSPDRSWLGAGAAVAVVVAMASPRLMRRHSGWFFLAAGGLLLLKIHGLPGLQLIGRLPVVDRMNFIAFADPIVNFCLAVVVAIGVQSLAEGAVRPGWFAGLLGLLALAVAGLVLANRPVLATPPHHSPWRQYVLYAVALTAAGGVTVAALVAIWLPRMRRLAALGAAAIISLELLAFFGPGAYLPRTNPYRPPPWLALARAGLSGAPQGRVFGLNRALYPNTAGVFGLQDIRTLDALFVARYRTYVRDFITPRFTDRFTGEYLSPSEIEGNPMFDLLGVRVVLTRRTALPVSPGAGSQYQLLGAAGGVSVYENQSAAPRAFVVSNVKQVATMNAAIAYLRGLGQPQPDGTARLTGFDPTADAVVEATGRPVISVPSVSSPPTSRAVRIASYSAGQVTIDVGPGSPGLLVLTDTYLPGWQATVNGTRVPVLPADVAFRGVALSGRTSTVVFRYRPAGGRSGWIGPVVALLAVGALLWLDARRLRFPAHERARA
jgi:hypothetical protein